MSSTCPSSTATPNEVRAYLVQVLIIKHNATADYANKVAKKWGLGRGLDLRRMRRSDFQNWFGHADGYYLFDSVQEDIRSNPNKTPFGFIAYCRSTDRDSIMATDHL